MLKVFPSLFAIAKSNERKHWRILQPSPPPLRQLDQPSYFLSTSFFFWGGGGGGGEKGKRDYWEALPPFPRKKGEGKRRNGRNAQTTGGVDQFYGLPSPLLPAPPTSSQKEKEGGTLSPTLLYPLTVEKEGRRWCTLEVKTCSPLLPHRRLRKVCLAFP